MNLATATQICRDSGLSGWELVAFAQRLVNKQMKYSVENSLDSPEAAFEKGQGYCWHQASALNLILLELGFDSRRVHAFRNLFPEVEMTGLTVHNFISGHVWCRVKIDGAEKDVCPGSKDNVPGIIPFTPLGKVYNWNRGIEVLTYYGSALVNAHRGKKYGAIKEKQEVRWNPEKCPCKKKTCERYKNCEACKAYHYAKDGLPYCER